MRLRLIDNGDETFTLLDDVVWFDLETQTFVRAHAGGVTDFASVPRIFWPIIPPYGRHGHAAVIHDELYRLRGSLPERQLTRADCDRIFRDIMAVDGVRWTRRWVMWLGVRIGGWLPWHFGDRSPDEPTPLPA